MAQILKNILLIKEGKKNERTWVNEVSCFFLPSGRKEGGREELKEGGNGSKKGAGNEIREE